jgi:alpha-amylase/alpha-mannosidase (GH57 family)
MWLPEMAVDFSTLQALVDNGLKFTILSQAQVIGATDGAGPYWVVLPSGDRLAVYVRDDWLSNQLAFSIQTLGGAGRWSRSSLAATRREYGRLLLLALDGETFGYYYPGEEHFLHWLLYYEAEGVGYEVTTLARDLHEHPPTKEIGIVENTAWNCAHGLARWKTGCGCTPGDSSWKGALRGTMEHLAATMDELYVEHARDLGVANPWKLREDFLGVRLGLVTQEQLLAQHGLEHDRQAAGLRAAPGEFLQPADVCELRVFPR